MDSKTSSLTRGFRLVQFNDYNGASCSIQESSACPVENEDGSCDNPLGWVWLGIDDGNPQIMVSDARKMGLPVPEGQTNGWCPYFIPEQVMINTRMHLNEAQVRGIVKKLNNWLDNGRIHDKK